MKLVTLVQSIHTKLKEKTVQSELARKERDARKRKIMLDQLQALHDVEIKKDEDSMIQRFKLHSQKVRIFLFDKILGIGSI